MRLSVHGSRSLSDERVKVLLLEEIDEYAVTEIVTHGELGGVCQVARDLCRELAIPLTCHFLNFKYRRGAFEHRSIAVLKGTERALFIHDGKSKGTMNELKLAQKMNLPHTLHTLAPALYNKSVGFDITEDWGAMLNSEEISLALIDEKVKLI